MPQSASPHNRKCDNKSWLRSAYKKKFQFFLNYFPNKNSEKSKSEGTHRVMRTFKILFFCETLNCAREMNQIAYIVSNNYHNAIRRGFFFFFISLWHASAAIICRHRLIECYKVFVRTLIANLFLLFANGKLNEKSKPLRCASCGVCIFYAFLSIFLLIFFTCPARPPCKHIKFFIQFMCLCTWIFFSWTTHEQYFLLLYIIPV